jgi:Co/Zn/Cd efflux system component
MADDCCDRCADSVAADPRQRRTLAVVLAINVAGFAMEAIAGVAASSTALQADALDFLGDAGNYALSLMVLGMALKWRSRAALLKGVVMGLFGFWVMGAALWNLAQGTLPSAPVMGAVGFVALGLNAVSLALLTGFRRGDANLRSVWICTRNDVLGNLAVLAAALGVFGTGAGWPDAIVAAIMAALALWGSARVIRLARRELAFGEVRSAA